MFGKAKSKPAGQLLFANCQLLLSYGLSLGLFAWFSAAVARFLSSRLMS